MKRKLAVFGLSFSLAQLAAAHLAPPAVWLAALLALVGIAAAVLRTRKAGPVTLVLSAAVLGMGCHLAYCALVVEPVQAYAGRTVQVTGTVGTDADTSYQEDRLTCTLYLTRIDGEAVDLRVSCGSFPGTGPGETFTATLRLDLLPDNRYRLNHYSDGVFLSAEYLDGYRYQGQSSSPEFLLYRLRRELSRRLTAWLPEEEGSVEAAMLIGDTAGLSQKQEDNFRVAGVSHLLAVSGLHVTLLCGLFNISGDPRRRFSRPRILVQAAVLIFYLALIGFPVSAVRAALISLVALAGCFFLQPPDTLTSMGAAAVMLGALNAYLPCDLGFQLSFSAVIGVQLSAEISRWTRAHIPDPETPLLSLARRLLLSLMDAVHLSALASLATMPALLANGLTVSGVSVLANLLVVWMVQPAMLLGIVVLVLSFIPFLGFAWRGFSLILSIWLRVMCDIIGWCAQLPGARLALPAAYTLLVLAVLGALGWLFWYRRRLAWYLPAAAVCTAAAIGLGVWMSRDVVRIAVVGTAGNPCLVVTQNGRAAVLFRGGADNLHAAQEYLLDAGGQTVELVVDLRRQPRDIDFGVDTVIAMDHQGDGLQTISLLDGLTLELLHDSGGNLAVLDVKGYTVGIMAGRVTLPGTVRLNVFCAGAGYPDTLDADTVLYTSRSAGWLDEAEARGARLLYGPDEPQITIRPGHSAVMEGVKTNAVQ